MTDPMSDIEERQGNIDMGRLAAQIFEGALMESGSWYKALLATAAWFTGMFKANQDDGDEHSG